LPVSLPTSPSCPFFRSCPSFPPPCLPILTSTHPCSDIIIGDPAFGADRARDGAVFVIFGRSKAASFPSPPFPATLSLSFQTLDGTQGTTIKGAAHYDAAGISVGAGDINGDGLADVIIGAPYGDPDASRPDAGR
jgi:hypothetical protein